MLEIVVPIDEIYDEEAEEFVATEVKLELEHSLLSLSKWESKHEKRFLGNTEMTPEEIIDYIKLMTITRDVSPEVFNALTNGNIEQIRDYIASSQTATTFPAERPGPTSREQISSELIYYWMIKCQIPWEAERWHLNRLFTLIKVYTTKEGAQEKKGPQQKRDAATERAAENARRRAEMQSRG